MKLAETEKNVGKSRSKNKLWILGLEAKCGTSLKDPKKMWKTQKM